MNTDWRDALSALKESGNVPFDNTPDATPEKSDITRIQSSPLVVATDRKGRKGKTATIIEGFAGSDEALGELARSLKQKLGTGGSSRGGEILIQGDRKKEAAALLLEMGYKVKLGN